MKSVEYIIWGLPPNSEFEDILHTTCDSLGDAERVRLRLETEFGCTKTRIQVLDLRNPQSVIEGFKRSINL
jgi:hypothetical protein